MLESNKGVTNETQSQQRSCDQCRLRKIKCHFAKPRCETCVSRGKACSYNDPIRKRGPKPRHVDNSESTPSLTQNLTEGSYSSTPAFSQNPNEGSSSDSTSCHQNPTEESFSSMVTPIPIPISISYASGTSGLSSYDFSGSPSSFRSVNHTPTGSYLSSLSREVSPSGSLKTSFGGLNIQSNGFGSNGAYEQRSLSPINFTPSNSYNQNILSEMYNPGHLSPVSFHSYPPTSQHSTRPQSPVAYSPAISPVENSFSKVTELELSLLDLFYQTIHPTFLLIPKDAITDLSCLSTDYSLQFLIYSMCAAAASRAPQPHLAEHAPVFLMLARDIAKYISNRHCDHFVWGVELLQLYFNEPFFSYPSSH